MHNCLKKFETKHLWYPSKLKSRRSSSKLKNVPILGGIGKLCLNSEMIIIKAKKRIRISVERLTTDM